MNRPNQTHEENENQTINATKAKQKK